MAMLPTRPHLFRGVLLLAVLCALAGLPERDCWSSALWNWNGRARPWLWPPGL
jgi:hypothetical protein